MGAIRFSKTGVYHPLSDVIFDHGEHETPGLGVTLAFPLELTPAFLFAGGNFSIIPGQGFSVLESSFILFLLCIFV